MSSLYVYGSFDTVFAAQALSKEIAQALREQLNPLSVSNEDLPGRFMEVCEAATAKFMECKKEKSPEFVQELTDRVALPVNLASLYLSHIIPGSFFARSGEDISLKKLQLRLIPGIENELPSIEEIFREAHERVEKMEEEPVMISNPLPIQEAVPSETFIAELLKEPYGPAYAASLLSLEIEESLKMHLIQMSQPEEAPRKLFKQICQAVTVSFLQRNFGTDSTQDFCRQVEISTELVRHYLGIAADDNRQKIPLNEIALLEIPEVTLVPLAQEIDAILPSMESHLAEAHMRGEEIAKADFEAKVEAARLAAEKHAKETAELFGPSSRS
jgi:hypothetical protein